MGSAPIQDSLDGYGRLQEGSGDNERHHDETIEKYQVGRRVKRT